VTKIIVIINIITVLLKRDESVQKQLIPTLKTLFKARFYSVAFPSL